MDKILNSDLDIFYWKSKRVCLDFHFFSFSTLHYFSGFIKAKKFFIIIIIIQQTERGRLRNWKESDVHSNDKLFWWWWFFSFKSYLTKFNNNRNKIPNKKTVIQFLNWIEIKIKNENNVCQLKCVTVVHTFVHLIFTQIDLTWHCQVCRQTTFNFFLFVFLHHHFWPNVNRIFQVFFSFDEI